MIAAGGAFGAPIPFHADASNPGKISLTAGTFGNMLERAGAVTASVRTLPALIGPIAVDTVKMKAWTCQPIWSTSGEVFDNAWQFSGRRGLVSR